MEYLMLAPFGFIFAVALLLAICDDSPLREKKTDPPEQSGFKISETSEGNKYHNVLKIAVPGEDIRIEGFSMVQHTVKSFIQYCDRVRRSDDGITVYTETECFFIPMDKVQRVTVTNELICSCESTETSED